MLFQQLRETSIMRKIRPIDKFLQKYANPCTVLIAIDSSETAWVRDPSCRWITDRYPLINQQIDRPHCGQIIRQHEWPVPPKSGCWLCPFNRLKAWQNLHVTNPNLYKRAQALEEASWVKRGPKAQFHQSGTFRDLASKRLNPNTLNELGDYLPADECSGV